MRLKKKLIGVLLIALVVSNCVIGYAGTISRTYKNEYGDVSVAVFLNREAAPFYDYNSWRYVVFGKHSDAFVHDVEFTFKTKKETTAKYEKDDLRAFDPYGKGCAIYNFGKNTIGISMKIDGSGITINETTK